MSNFPLRDRVHVEADVHGKGEVHVLQVAEASIRGFTSQRRVPPKSVLYLERQKIYQELEFEYTSTYHLVSYEN